WSVVVFLAIWSSWDVPRQRGATGTYSCDGPVASASSEQDGFGLLWWGRGQTAPALRTPGRDLRRREHAVGHGRLLGRRHRTRAMERAGRHADGAGRRRRRAGGA